MSTLPQDRPGIIPGVVLAPQLARDGVIPPIEEMTADEVCALHLATMQLRQRALDKCNAIADLCSAEISRRINAAEARA